MEAPILEESLSETPSAQLHRVLKPLNFIQRPKVAVDGCIKTKTVDGDKNRVLRAQSGKLEKSPGVSFFEFYEEHFEASHDCLGVGDHGCGVTAPNTPLPSNLGLVCDGPRMLPLKDKDGETIAVAVGKLWSLFPTVDMEPAIFETKFAELRGSFSACMLPKGGAEPKSFDIDLDYLPTDRLARVAVLALGELGHTANDPNTRMFARLYAGHIPAVDMDFKMVLEDLPMALMTGLAFESFETPDPMLYADAYEAQLKLSELLTDDDLKLAMPVREQAGRKQVASALACQSKTRSHSSTPLSGSRLACNPPNGQTFVQQKEPAARDPPVESTLTASKATLQAEATELMARLQLDLEPASPRGAGS